MRLRISLLFFIITLALVGTGVHAQVVDPAAAAAEAAAAIASSTAAQQALFASSTKAQKLLEDAILKQFSTSTQGIPDYLLNAKPPTEADAPALPVEYQQIPLNIEMTPEFPAAFQTVSVSVDSYSADMDRATITWIINGKLIAKGPGLKNFSFKAGKNGSYTSLTVIVNNAGIETKKTLSVTPATVDLVWQSDSYVPPFYKGKALYSHQSKLKIVAIPNIFSKTGELIPPSKLVYHWKKDHQIVAAVAGLGKNTVNFTEKIPVLEKSISVEVSTADGTVNTAGETILRSTATAPIIYEDNPLTGITYEKALLSNFTLLGSEMKLAVEPFFFSAQNGNKESILYTWALNGNEVPNVSRSNIVFKVPSEEKGTAQVTVNLTSIGHVFQTSLAGSYIKFNSPGDTQ